MKRELKVIYQGRSILPYDNYRTIPYEEGTESLPAPHCTAVALTITEPFPMKRELKVICCADNT